jgi:hypothetical protein
VEKEFQGKRGQVDFLLSAPVSVVPSVSSIFLLQDVKRSDPAKGQQMAQPASQIQQRIIT